MKYSIVMTQKINDLLINHLIRKDLQEDLCFGFYSPGTGHTRKVGIINEIMIPKATDRNIHGNVSFNPEYFDKVTKYALHNNLGIVFMHSHPSPGWQNMSPDDISAEKTLAPRVKAVSGLPLIGMTVGSNGDWSARFWIKSRNKEYKKFWCESVRVVGRKYEVTYNDNILRPPKFDTKFKRTVSAWGNTQQQKIARIKVGIIGIGSVGSQIGEALLRTGLCDISLIDYDIIKEHNLDRLPRVNVQDIGKLKVDIYKEIFSRDKLFKNQLISSIPCSIIEKEGFERAIDCDIIFCCVDKPWPRFILNCISYLYFIPVIDGGIDSSFDKKKNNLEQARWRSFVTGPGRRCMKCMGQYLPEDVSLQQSGLLNDPNYIKGLPENHFIKKGENVYCFSLALAGMHMQQFLSLILNPKGVYYGPKEMDFVTGNIDSQFKFSCDDNCEMNKLQGKGDYLKDNLIQRDIIAEKTRAKAINNSK